MLDLAPRRVRALARAGLVNPRRGVRHEYRFSFTDLVVIRTARDLLAAGVPFARVRRSLANLKDQLPEGRSLTGVRVQADGRRVTVRHDGELWDPESNQSLLDFDVAELARQVAPLARDAAARADGSEPALLSRDWFEIGCDLEMTCPDEARDAYRQALEANPESANAHVNLGRLLHESGDVRAAEQHYREALAVRRTDLTALFNLGVALEDLGRLKEARAAYRETLLADPDHADAHFNLAGVLERMGRKPDALKHLKAYRQLIAQRGWNSDDLSV